MAAECHGRAVPWEGLDEVLVHADIVLSTTGDRNRSCWCGAGLICAKCVAGPAVILDIAVPRDFDPRIHDADTAFLFEHRRPQADSRADHRPVARNTSLLPRRSLSRRLKKFLETGNLCDKAHHCAIASGFRHETQ